MDACAQRLPEEEVTQTTTVTEVPKQVCGGDTMSFFVSRD